MNLYSTSNCHLCELAETLLSQISTPLNVVPIEIVNIDALLTQYGSHIPVLQRQDNLRQLYWPFTLQELESFLA
ncbi:MAG TPA: thioredoxin family protein [Methylophilaceae bacterium]|nr:thioredoxin family protein [Methylophilaceae bacterium]HAJ71806.1 thioredoxin family protein [Methylophilaceae bacterium]